MAIIGQNVQAGLGRIDYTPYLQGASMGAQGIAQGIAAIGQGAAKGIQDYFKKQEEAKQEEGASSMIARILKTNPGLSSQLGLTPDDKGEFDPGAIKAAIKGAGGPVNAIKLAATLEELGIQQKTRQEQQAAATYASLLTQGGGEVPSVVSKETMDKFSPEAKTLGKGLYLQQARQQAELAKTNAEVTRLLARATPDAPVGYRYTKEGNLEEIPGGPAAASRASEAEKLALSRQSAARQEQELKLKLEEAATKAQNEQEKKRLADEALKTSLEDAKLSANTTLREIDKARPLINAPLAQGFGSSISGFFGGTSGSDLEASYDVIRANEALSRIIALKKASPTGATGLGALNLKELETLQTRFAKLSRSVSDQAANSALDDLERVITKAFPDVREQIEAEKRAEKARSTRTASPYAAPVRTGSRYDVLNVSP